MKTQIKPVQITLLMLVVLCAIALSGCRQDSNSSPTLHTIYINDHPLSVEIADTPKKRQKGLMFRKVLPKNNGMLFVFQHEKYLSFWMRNTRIPLSIAYIRHDGTIIDIAKMQPFDERPHKSSHKATYALEVNQGWFKEHAVHIGDKVIIPSIATQ